MLSRLGRSTGALVALAVAGSVIVGCGNDDRDTPAKTSGSTTAAKQPTDIAFLTWNYTDYVQAEERGVKKVLSESGGSVKVFNANLDPQKQQQQCEDAITSGRYNALILSPVAPPLGVPCVKAAKAAGIPVATIEQTVGTDPAKTYDITPQVDGVVSVSTLTLDKQVEAESELVRQACEGHDPCKVVYELISPDCAFCKGVIEGIKAQVPSVDVVHQFVSGVAPPEVVKAMPDILSANPDLNVYVAAADSSGLAALPAIKAAGLTDQIKVIGSGGSGLGAKAIAAGTLFGSVANWPTQNGEYITRALVQAVNGEEVTFPGSDGLTIDKPLTLTKETVSRFKPEW